MSHGRTLTAVAAGLCDVFRTPKATDPVGSPIPRESFADPSLANGIGFILAFFTHINTAQSHLANRASAPECRQDSTHILFRLPPLLTMVSILFHGFSTKCHFCAILSTDNPLRVFTRRNLIAALADDTSTDPTSKTPHRLQQRSSRRPGPPPPEPAHPYRAVEAVRPLPTRHRPTDTSGSQHYRFPATA